MCVAVYFQLCHSMRLQNIAYWTYAMLMLVYLQTHRVDSTRILGPLGCSMIFSLTCVCWPLFFLALGQAEEPLLPQGAVLCSAIQLVITSMLPSKSYTPVKPTTLLGFNRQPQTTCNKRRAMLRAASILCTIQMQ